MVVIPRARRILCVPLIVALAVASADAQVAAGGAGDPAAVRRAIARIAAVAHETDPTVLTARAHERAAEQRAASAGLAPPLAAAVALSDGPGGDLLRGNASVEVGRDLLLGPRLAAARATAVVEFTSRSRDRQAAEAVVDVRVTDLVVHGAAAARVLVRLRQSERLLADAEDALAVRLAAGSGRYADVLRVRTERLTVGFSIRDEIARLATVRGRLMSMTAGGFAADTLDAWIGEAAIAIGSPGGWRPVLDSLPPLDSLIALASAVRESGATLQRARAIRSESVASRRAAMNGAVGIQRIGEANGGPSVGLLFGISSTLPFTARRSNTLASDASDAEVRAAEIEAGAAVSGVRPALESLRERHAVALSRLDAIDGAVLVAAQSEREAALAEFRAGSLTLLELLDLERALLRVELERADALREAASLRASLFGVAPHESGDRP